MGMESDGRDVVHRAMQRTPGVRRGAFASVPLCRVTWMRGFAMVLLVLCGTAGTAGAQMEPALPGSIEYSLINNSQTWIDIPDAITVGSYVEDLLTSRANQPAGRGMVGIVTATGFDQDY